MKKNVFLLINLTLFSMSLISCKENEITSSEVQEEQEIEEDVLFDENYREISKLSNLEAMNFDDIMYDDDEFGRFDNIKYQQLYYNNQIDNDRLDGTVTDNDDAKYLFYNDDHLRFVNRSEGYALNLASDSTFKGDFSLAKYRSKIYNRDITLTISREQSNPYGWAKYRDEWLIRYVNNPKYLKDNDLEYVEDVMFEDESFIKDYRTSIFSIKINNPGNIRKCYYNIGYKLPKNDFAGKDFYLFVMKSTTNQIDNFKEMLKSFSKINQNGNKNNQIKDLELSYEPTWTKQTKDYFDKLVSQDRTDWGIYNYGISSSGQYESNLINKMSELEQAVDYSFDILPTYTHLLANNGMTSFPLTQANKHALGDGFNGKKVLQFTYQFTSNNNNVTASNTTQCYTPMFDILRGPHETLDVLSSDFRDRIYQSILNLTENIKQYEAPVLFRLNNEMNSDWVSYCGMMTLLDPDIFCATWRYLYNFMIEHGVNNTIWIFNPNGLTAPYCSWGEDMCYYPGLKYVQALGLTYYEANNDNKVTFNSFKNDYESLYNKNKTIWNKYPMIISEFACGAGGNASGERFRNQASQADYVDGMFECLNNKENYPFAKNIKGAVWFSANDFASNGATTNQYELVVDSLPLTIQALKNGLAINKEKQ